MHVGMRWCGSAGLRGGVAPGGVSNPGLGAEGGDLWDFMGILWGFLGFDGKFRGFNVWGRRNLKVFFFLANEI